LSFVEKIPGGFNLSFSVLQENDSIHNTIR
jgi:hypothetical protein